MYQWIRRIFGQKFVFVNTKILVNIYVVDSVRFADEKWKIFVEKSYSNSRMSQLQNSILSKHQMFSDERVCRAALTLVNWFKVAGRYNNCTRHRQVWDFAERLSITLSCKVTFSNHFYSATSVNEIKKVLFSYFFLFFVVMVHFKN